MAKSGKKLEKTREKWENVGKGGEKWEQKMGKSGKKW